MTDEQMSKIASSLRVALFVFLLLLVLDLCKAVIAHYMPATVVHKWEVPPEKKMRCAE